MTALARQVAADVAELLTAFRASVAYTVKRGYLLESELAELAEDDTLVWVVPKRKDTTPAGRHEDEVAVSVDVAVQGRARTTDECDALLDVADELADHLNRRPLPNVENARWLGQETSPLWNPDDLHQRHLFTALVTVTYYLTREAS